MIRSALFIVILLISSFTYAGEGRISRSFSVQTDMQEIADWLNSHHDEVAESTHCHIISRRGELIRVKRTTMKGDFEFTLREKITEGTHRGTYSTTLVKCYKGDITKEDILVTFTKSGSGTKIDISAECIVNNPRIKNVEVVAGLSVSARGFERMIKSRF